MPGKESGVGDAGPRPRIRGAPGGCRPRHPRAGPRFLGPAPGRLGAGPARVRRRIGRRPIEFGFRGCTGMCRTAPVREHEPRPCEADGGWRQTSPSPRGAQATTEHRLALRNGPAGRSRYRLGAAPRCDLNRGRGEPGRCAADGFRKKIWRRPGPFGAAIWALPNLRALGRRRTESGLCTPDLGQTGQPPGLRSVRAEPTSVRDPAPRPKHEQQEVRAGGRLNPNRHPPDLGGFRRARRVPRKVRSSADISRTNSSSVSASARSACAGAHRTRTALQPQRGRAHPSHVGATNAALFPTCHPRRRSSEDPCSTAP